MSYRVSEKMSNGQQYSLNEATEILNEIYRIKQSLSSGKQRYKYQLCQHYICVVNV